MSLFLPAVGLGEQPADHLDEHRDRIVGELLAELGDLRNDQRVPAAGIEVVGEPGGSSIALSDHLIPPPGRNARLQTGIDAECSQEGNPISQPDQVRGSRRLSRRAQPMEACLCDRRINFKQPIECIQRLGRDILDQRRLRAPASYGATSKPDLLSAPRWRVSPVEGDSTQIVVDWSGS